MVEEKVIQQESVAPVEQSVAATDAPQTPPTPTAVSYTHLRAHET